MEFTIYSRAGCHLCEEMIQQLEAVTAGHAVRIRVVDIDAEPELSRRYGLRIPVLEADGEEVCSARLAPGRIAALLQADI